MYIYWSNKIVISDPDEQRAQGLIIAPEKGGKDPFQPAVSGDTVTAILPAVIEGNAVITKQQIVLEEVNDSLPILNSGSYLFAYEGDVYGEVLGGSGNTEIKGIIFKAAESGSECAPKNNPGDTVLVITDYAEEKLDTPEILLVTVSEKPEE